MNDHRIYVILLLSSYINIHPRENPLNCERQKKSKRKDQIWSTLFEADLFFFFFFFFFSFFSCVYYAICSPMCMVLLVHTTDFVCRRAPTLCSALAVFSTFQNKTKNPPFSCGLSKRAYRLWNSLATNGKAQSSCCSQMGTLYGDLNRSETGISLDNNILTNLVDFAHGSWWLNTSCNYNKLVRPAF